MAGIIFVIPSVLNGGGGERRLEIDAATLAEAFEQASGVMDDGFRRRVLEADGTPRSLINVYINGKNSKFSSGMETILRDGDEVYILPAVAGGSQLSSRDLDRYSRQVMLDEIGYEGQLKLRSATVCIVGMGGLGNPISSRLAAMGVGAMRIIDRDVVELSNLHRQTLFDEGDVGKIKVEAAAEKLAKLNPSMRVESLPVSVSDGTAPEVIEGCDVVIDALDSVNARYALNRACVAKGIPFVTGAAVGVSGQVFTIMPGRSACYSCIFPSLDEEAMPTCSIEGVHPSILSMVGGIEVAEAVKVILNKEPSLSGRILHMNIDNLDFSFTRTFRVDECTTCGSGARLKAEQGKVLVEELCGREGGKRTFSLTPAQAIDLDVGKMSKAASGRGFKVENLGEMGISMRTESLYVSFMKSGSAIMVGTKDSGEALMLYDDLLGGTPSYTSD